MTTENKTRFEMVGDVPVLFLASSTPTQVYKDAILLRRTRREAGHPLPERLWAGFDAASRLTDLDGAETARALSLAHFQVLGFIGDRQEVAILARSARLPHAQPAPQATALARAEVDDEAVAELESWVTPPIASSDTGPEIAPSPTDIQTPRDCSPCRQAVGVVASTAPADAASPVGTAEDTLPPSSQWTLEDIDLPTLDDQADRVALSLADIAPVDAVTKADAPLVQATPEADPSDEGVSPPGTLAPEMVYPATCVRSRIHTGQVVEGPGDVIATRLVGNGAELVAGGSIHAYGPLLGRALAGAYGDTAARIYAADFRAELVSIAGRFQVFEEIPEEILGKAVEIWLEGEILRFAPLGEVGCPSA